MALIQYKENTRTRRFASKLVKPGKNFGAPKNLKKLLKQKSGRGSGGRVSVRHQGGRHKTFYRVIDFKRDKFNVEGEVVVFEYDPNRNVNIALINYSDGDKRYILAPGGLKVGDKILSGEALLSF